MSAPSDEASLSSPPPPLAPAGADASSKWCPYSGPGDFGTNTLIVVAVLFVTLLFALSLNAAIRFLFRTAARLGLSRHPPPPPAEPEKRMAAPGPTLVFSAGTKLAGVEAECAICLAEFVEGERLKVLAPCNHGFHVHCIEPWLAARSSCPTCRCRCHVAVGSEGKTPAVAEA